MQGSKRAKTPAWSAHAPLSDIPPEIVAKRRDGAGHLGRVCVAEYWSASRREPRRV